MGFCESLSVSGSFLTFVSPAALAGFVVGFFGFWPVSLGFVLGFVVAGILASFFLCFLGPCNANKSFLSCPILRSLVLISSSYKFNLNGSITKMIF